jgi:hypothetical protein
VCVKCSFYLKCVIQRYVKRMCVCLSVCLSVPGSTNHPVTQSKPNVSSKTSMSGHVTNVVFACPCRRTGAANSVTPYSLVVPTHGVGMFGMFLIITCDSFSEKGIDDWFLVLCGQVEVSATGRFLVQRSPTECDQVRQ